MEMPLSFTLLYLQKKHKTNSRKKKANSNPKQMLKTQEVHCGRALLQRKLINSQMQHPLSHVLHLSLRGGNVAVQAMLQQQGVGGPVCRQERTSCSLPPQLLRQFLGDIWIWPVSCQLNPYMIQACHTKAALESKYLLPCFISAT